MDGEERTTDASAGASPAPPSIVVQRGFPVDGDGAVVELSLGATALAEVWLNGIDVAAIGSRRTDWAKAVIKFFPVGEELARSAAPLDLEDLLAHLTEARQWLYANEEGRSPVDPAGLTRAGAAISKMGADALARFTVPPASPTLPPVPAPGTGDHTVLLEAVGTSPLAVTRAVRIITGFGLHDAKALLADAPVTVVTRTTVDDAQAALDELTAAGATARITREE